MSQVNVNTPGSVPPNDNGGSAVAAGINMVTVLILIAVAIVVILGIIWLFTGSGVFAHGGTAPVPAGVITATASVTAPAK
ncbi:MAG: hypothetical protein ACR2JY_20720 [Chloroflexota bacterium]